MYKRYVKRIFDILISLLAMPFIGVLIIFVGTAIFLEDRGSVFYKARRRGINGTIFEMYKFRSMKMNAPDIRNEDNSTYNSPDDPRITRVGRFLRKTSIDELPQFINVSGRKFSSRCGICSKCFIFRRLLNSVKINSDSTFKKKCVCCAKRRKISKGV